MKNSRIGSAIQEDGLLAVRTGIIVHGCNARGVMGSGLAAQVRAVYPQAWRAYREHYEKQGLSPGQVVWCRISAQPPLAIANAITQDGYGRHGCFLDMDALAKCFAAIAVVASKHGLTVHYPMIGAGLAGGDWSRIEPVIERELAGCAHKLWLPPPSRQAPRP